MFIKETQNLIYIQNADFFKTHPTKSTNYPKRKVLDLCFNYSIVEDNSFYWRTMTLFLLNKNFKLLFFSLIFLCISVYTKY